jgi:sugar-specific transcriptional regulator TrmB
MEKAIKDKLRDAGLTRNEIDVYLSLLDFGGGSVTEISKKCDVHRVNIYDVLRLLKTKGLVSEMSRGKTNVYKANEPEQLLSYIQTKEQEIRDILPNLRRSYDLQESSAQTFFGVQGLKHCILDFVRTKKTIYAFGIPKLVPELLFDFLKTFHRNRIRNKTRIYHIYNENAKERIAYLNRIKYSKAKHLEKKYDVPATTIIYGDKVAIWIFSEKEIFAVLIKSKIMAESYKKYFDILWERAI